MHKTQEYAFLTPPDGYMFGLIIVINNNDKTIYIGPYVCRLNPTECSGWSDCRIRAFYPESGKPMYVVNSAFGAMVTAIATYSNCQKIISGSDLGHVVVWDVPQWRVTNDLNYASKHFLLKEHKATVTCIKMIKDDTECVTSSIDGSCVIWDLV